ncbi:glutamate carboxypeptidase [Thermosporothrix hazakensis]|jgi:glutamate carboxypeptidase|uniref:Glutamate carboxypeptidase n=2 Tax=Thermosporothrix TaxID=768650 RepID=A0A326U8I8_THEHA|nr:M20 family metallopeptidase [Thermosporothrix hazakensis]PZW20791.1 glutamate carboxypeptidase [Thermosporothrix hazakensis]BBH89372.1 glutamate carboxypeptidase [Thermosporothrix sp. COM3]GCE47554.1 glutamate carboxypeptidase [Thermosporothrix hazakensis]
MQQEIRNTTYASSYLPLFRSYLPEFLKRLETLVNIDSGTGQIAGVNRIIEQLQIWLHELGCKITLHPVEEFGNNLVAQLEGTGTQRIALVGHIDTVYQPGATQLQPFSVKGSAAYGPGVLDMKSGVLLALYIMRAFQEKQFHDYRELYLVINNDEEVGSPGSHELLTSIAHKIDVGLVLEPSLAFHSITSARKGTDRYLLEVQGVSAHSGAEPQKGRSAVVELAHKILAIQHLNSMFPEVTFNCTCLSSTETLNIIPDMARCYVSVRAGSQEALDQAARALESIAIGQSIPDTITTLTRTPGRRPYQVNAGIQELLERLQAEARALDISLSGEVDGGVSDANILAATGVPTLDSLGPVGSGMHNLEQEHLIIETIPIRGALVAGLIHQLCLSKLTG